MINNLTDAIQLARNGFSIVPIIPNTKRPAIQHADKPPMTLEQIHAFWSKHPDYGIAVKTTSFFSIDIDTPEHSGTTKIDGRESVKKYFNGSLLPETLTATTPSGGVHFYYQKIDGKPNKSLAGIYPGIDLQADNNSISIIPPTIRDGKAYQWKNTKPITKPPIELIRMLQKQLKPNYSNYKLNGISNNSNPPNYLAGLLEEMVMPQEKGKRNTYLTHVIGKLLVTGITVDTAYKYATFTNSNFTEPLPIKEVNQTFRSILNKELNKRN